MLVGAVQTYLKEYINYNDYLFWFTYIGSIGFYSVIGLNVDRAYVLSYPLKGRTSMKVLKLILVCWFLALFPSVPYLLDHTLDICAQNCTACWIPVDNVKYYLLEVIGGIFDLNLLFQPPIVIWHSFCHTTPLLLIFGAWLQITRAVKSSKKDCKPANKRIQTSHKYNI